MKIFLFILTNNIVPIFSIIFIGYIIGKKFNLHIETLSKLNFYIYVPVFAFTNLYTTALSINMLKVVIFSIVLLMANGIIGFIISKLIKANSSITNAFKNSVMFYNTGNIGIPLITLVFTSMPHIINGKTPYLNLALTTQIMVLVVQNVTTNTIGFFNAGKANTHWKASLKKIYSMPTIYAIPLAFLCKLIPYDLTKLCIWPALDYITTGMISIALITLGVQLSKTAFKFTNKNIYISSFVRLIGSPVIALCLIYCFGFKGVIAQVLIISSGLPTAVNTALIAVECKNSPDFASQVVLISTLLSTITLTLNIYVSNLLFPI